MEYKIGLSYFHDGSFPKAILYYNKVIKNYPQSKYAKKALLGVATALFSQSIPPPQDQTMTRRAREEFKKFQQLFPDSPLQKYAKEKITTLNEQLAMHLHKIASFYKRRGEIVAAKIYHKSILSGFPETSWATRSRDLLNELTAKITIP